MAQRQPQPRPSTPAPINVTKTTTVKAISVTPGYSPSIAATGAYTIQPASAATPVILLPSGDYTGAQTVSISDATAGAVIYYTTDGSTPTTSSPKYTGAIGLSSSVTLQAIAVASGYSTSAVAVALYNIVPPPAPPTVTSITPGGGPTNTAANVTLSGTGFTPSSTVAVNGAQIPANYLSPTEITLTMPASSVILPGNVNVTVTTAAGTSAPIGYTAYLGITNNDIVYNPADGLLYASVPFSELGSGGNSVVGIDPVTGNVNRQIWVGSNPNKLALSTDGTQLFVGLDGAGAVAQVNLTTGKVVNQFSLGGGQGLYNSPHTAQYLAAVPGSPNSVAVAETGGYAGGSGVGVAIYDSGMVRASTSTNFGSGPLSFGSSASTLYMAASGIQELTVGPSGITAATTLSSNTGSGNLTWIQYDNGQLYLSSGAVLNASTGALLGTFYSTPSTAANGPVVSDSTLGQGIHWFVKLHQQRRSTRFR